MTRLIAIDPGYSARGDGCAVALFDAGVLVRTWFARPERALPPSPRVDRVVWEMPQLDARSRRAAPAVLGLAATGGELAGIYAAGTATIERVTPSQWKGSVPKPVAHGRLWRVLTDAERAWIGDSSVVEERIDAAKRAGALERWRKEGARYYGAWSGHNLLDAVGIGLYALGRVKGAS